MRVPTLALGLALFGLAGCDHVPDLGRGRQEPPGAGGAASAPAAETPTAPTEAATPEAAPTPASPRQASPAAPEPDAERRSSLRWPWRGPLAEPVAYAPGASRSPFVPRGEAAVEATPAVALHVGEEGVVIPGVLRVDERGLDVGGRVIVNEEGVVIPGVLRVDERGVTIFGGRAAPPAATPAPAPRSAPRTF